LKEETMIVFNPPYNSLKQLGQASSAPVTSVTPPASAPPNSYDAPMAFSTAGIVVAGIVGVGLTLTVATALLRRK
jgi:hypothetical protein